MKSKLGWAVMLSLLVGISHAQTAANKPPVPVDPLQAEFANLQKDYFTALNNYYKPLEQAKTEEEASKIKLDPKANPANSFLPKLQAFAKKAKKNPVVGVQAEAMVLDMAISIQDRKSADNSIKSLYANYANEPSITRALYSLEQYSSVFLGREGDTARNWTLSKLIELEKKSKNREVQASALGMQADVFAPPFGDVIDAKKSEAILIDLKNRYGDTRAGKRAEGRLFVLGNLNVGQQAPDFEVTDENGKTFKLSDYRGQVVVLDFWGFW